MTNPNIKDFGFGSKHRTKEFDDAARAKAKGVLKPRIWTKDKCLEELDFILGRLKKILIDDDKINVNNSQKLKAESIRDLNNMMGRILQFMQYLYPPVQQNINLNIDTTANAVIDRLKNWKEKEILELKNGN
jgi:hypothetical protein